MMYSSILDHSPDVCFARPAFPTMMKKLHTLSAVSPCVAHESSAGFACPLAVKVHRYVLHWENTPVGDINKVSRSYLST